MTICTQNRGSLFGAVADGEVQLNNAGRMIEQWWFELNRKFSTVETDEFVVMPNYFHGIVVIAGVTVGADLRVGPNLDGRAVHARGFARDLGGAAQGAADGCDKLVSFLFHFFSLHGSRKTGSGAILVISFCRLRFSTPRLDFCPSVFCRPLFNDKTNLPLRWLRRRHELADSVKDNLKLGIVLFLQCLQFPSQLSIGGE